MNIETLLREELFEANRKVDDSARGVRSLLVALAEALEIYPDLEDKLAERATETDSRGLVKAPRQLKPLRAPL